MLQFNTQNHRLQFIQPAVVTDYIVVVSVAAAVITINSNLLSNFIVICGYQPPVAISAKILARVKTKRPRLAKGAGHSSTVSTAKRLRTVFYD